MDEDDLLDILRSLAALARSHNATWGAILRQAGRTLVAEPAREEGPDPRGRIEAPRRNSVTLARDPRVLFEVTSAYAINPLGLPSVPPGQRGHFVTGCPPLGRSSAANRAAGRWLSG